MAELRKLNRDCMTNCGRPATLELFGRSMRPHGKFCQECAPNELAALQKIETEQVDFMRQRVRRAKYRRVES